MINRVFFFSVLTFNTENRPRRKKEMSENEGFSSSFLSHTYKAPQKNELESFRRFSSSSSLCVCSCNTDFITQASYFEVGVRIASPFNNLRLSRTEASCILMFLVLAFIIASSSVASTFILSGKTVFFSRLTLFSPALRSQQNRLRMLMLSRTSAHKLLCFRLRHKTSWHVS